MSESSRHRPFVQPFIDPLAECYRSARMPRLSATSISPEQMPEPYRRLLVHERDMTSTLEKHFAERIHLRTVRSRSVGSILVREVVLVCDRSERAVEFGAIRIHLDVFPERACPSIQEGLLPLGRILADHDIAYQSRPRGFLRWVSESMMARVFSIEEGVPLFGRQNVLEAPDGRPLAEVVEILPPLDLPPLDLEPS